jgi:hypothetical protein
MISEGVTTFWFDFYTPAKLEREPSRAEAKEKAIARWPPAYQERARKECDFRPETCERCRQLNWERWLGRPLRWYLELLLRQNSDGLFWGAPLD